MLLAGGGLWAEFWECGWLPLPRWPESVARVCELLAGNAVRPLCIYWLYPLTAFVLFGCCGRKPPGPEPLPAVVVR